MSLSANKILLANASTNTAGAYFQAVSVNATTAGVTVPAGIYQLVASTSLNSNVVIQFNTSTNIASPTWTNISTVNTSSLFISDGTNVQVLATANATITLYTPNGGQAASQSVFF
jgi:hypothetical protein